MVLPFLLPVAPDRYWGKMGFRPFRPALDFDAVSGGRAMAGFAQFPQAFCQSRGSARAGRCCEAFVVPAISASAMPKASGVAWQARDGESPEHGSSRLRIPPHLREVRKSTSGAAARGVTQPWRCGRVSTRASIMPILSRRARRTYATTLLRNVKRPFSSFPKKSSGSLHFTGAISLRRRGRCRQRSASTPALSLKGLREFEDATEQHTANDGDECESGPNTLPDLLQAQHLPAMGMRSATDPARWSPLVFCTQYVYPPTHLGVALSPANAGGSRS